MPTRVNNLGQEIRLLDLRFGLTVFAASVILTLLDVEAKPEAPPARPTIRRKTEIFVGIICTLDSWLRLAAMCSRAAQPPSCPIRRV